MKLKDVEADGVVLLAADYTTRGRFLPAGAEVRVIGKRWKIQGKLYEGVIGPDGREWGLLADTEVEDG